MNDTDSDDNVVLLRKALAAELPEDYEPNITPKNGLLNSYFVWMKLYRLIAVTCDSETEILSFRGRVLVVGDVRSQTLPAMCYCKYR